MAAWHCRGANPGAVQADPTLLASKDPEGPHWAGTLLMAGLTAHPVPAAFCVT